MLDGVQCEVEKQDQTQSEKFNVIGSSEPAAVDQQKEQYQTPVEKYLAPFLLRALEQAELKGYLSAQELLPVPILSKNASGAVKAQLKRMYRKLASSRYSLRRADFMLIRYGLVIEVDGSSHDSNDKRIRGDVTRDAEYAALEFSVFVIPNEEVYDFEARAKAFKKIVDLARLEEARPDFKQRWQRRRQAISRARKLLSTMQPDLDLGRYHRRHSLTSCFGDLKGNLQWSGYRFRLRKPKKDNSTSMNGSDENGLVEKVEIKCN